MTSATQGRRPTGPGAYHYEDGVMAFDCLVTRHHDMRRLVALYIGPWNGKRVDRWEPVDDMPGDFTPLTKPVAAPEPDWDDAPPDAQWHLYDSDCTAWWCTDDKQPKLLYDSEWEIYSPLRASSAGSLPIGVDWRTTLRRRPEVSGDN